MCESVQKRNSRLRAWGGVGSVPLPTAASRPSALQSVSASNFCASPSCQESSCPPSSPHLTPTPFSFCFGLWNSCPVDSCFHLQLCIGLGGNSARENRKIRRQEALRALPCARLPGSPLWGLPTLWLADREGICFWRLMPSDLR